MFSVNGINDDSNELIPTTKIKASLVKLFVDDNKGKDIEPYCLFDYLRGVITYDVFEKNAVQI